MTDSQPETPLGGCLIYIFWVVLGPIAAFLTGLILILQRPRIGSALDFVFAGCVLASIGARFLGRRTPDGDEPRTSAAKYAVGLLAAALSMFAFAHFVAPRVL